MSFSSSPNFALSQNYTGGMQALAVEAAAAPAFALFISSLWAAKAIHPWNRGGIPEEKCAFPRSPFLHYGCHCSYGQGAAHLRTRIGNLWSSRSCLDSSSQQPWATGYNGRGSWESHNIGKATDSPPLI